MSLPLTCESLRCRTSGTYVKNRSDSSDLATR